MNRTKIEWADWTWNPITGCLHGCPYCYARRAAEDGPYLRGRGGYDAVHPFEPAFHPNRLSEPCGPRQRPSLIFVSSMGDALGEWVPREWISQVIDVCQRAPRHRFLWLTKNPARYVEFDWPVNCWLGTSVTGYGDPQNDEYYRLVYLASAAELKAPGRTFISLEPFTSRVRFGLLSLPHTWAAAWVIMGAQTNPRVLPSRDAFLAMYNEVRASGARVFLKDSIMPVWNELHNNELPPRERPEGLRMEHGKSSK